MFLHSASGLRVSYAAYGIGDGFPVLYCHGFPGSAAEAKLAEAAALKFGVRIITVDRPGYGNSDFRTLLSYLDWVDDVQLLLEELNIDRFSVLGVSGGAPYAFAVSRAMGDRVIRTGIACGIGAFTTFASTQGMATVARLSLYLARVIPGLTGFFYRYLASRLFKSFPGAVLSILTGRAPPSDLEVLNNKSVRKIVMDSFRQAFIQGGQGATQDLLMMVRPWDFSISEINSPVYLWHGEADTTVPAQFSHWHESQLTNVIAQYFSAEGHFSLLVNYMDIIIQTLAYPGQTNQVNS